MKNDEFIWAALLHMGYNMWSDVPVPFWGPKANRQTDPEQLKWVCAADHLRFDEEVWRKVTAHMSERGMNMVVIDIGEALKLKSHPELAVKGSWDIDRFRKELARLRGMGLEPIPKLNFSTCHDTWLKDYHRMVSTPEYYKVCADVIRDALEVFKGTRFLHIGMDEEHRPTYQKYNRLLVMRQGELWWHDILWLVKEVEKHGVRAWMWHDFLRKNKMEEFEKRMPKTVVQSPWTYQVGDTTRYEKSLWIFKALSKGGYDTVPCSSHCYGGDEGFLKIAEWCKDNMAPAHFIGYQMAQWMQTGEAYRRLLFKGSALLAEAKRKIG
jgi:hypothetical protein